MRSSGRRLFTLEEPASAAQIRVRPPTRPMNMSRMSTAWDTPPSWGVMPWVRPTVTTAESVSNRQADRGSPSTELMIKPPPKNRVR